MRHHPSLPLVDVATPCGMSTLFLSEAYSMAKLDQPIPGAIPSAEKPPPLGGTATMIEVRGLDKHFGARRVLKGIDFSVKRGECVAIIGPSGSGKSTLI